MNTAADPFIQHWKQAGRKERINMNKPLPVETKPTFCRICEPACGLKVTTQGNRVLKIEADEDNVVTRGFVCSKGIRFKDVHESPDRLRHPIKRVGDRWERISWEQAFQEIGEKVKGIRSRHGGESFAMYMGNPAGFSGTHPVFCQAFLAGLGSKHFYTPGSQDCNNKFAASQRMYGSPFVQPIPDFDNVDCFIIVGSNPAISHMSFINAARPVERLKALEEKGGKVYFVNPRRTESARRVGEQVFIRPGTDIWFLLAFLNELIASGGVQPSVVDKYMKGFDAVEQLVQPWTPERAERVTGIPAATLRAMVSRYSNAKGGALYCSTGVNQAQHSTLAYWILNVINCVSGNLDRRGGMLVSRGLVDLPKIAKKFGYGDRTDRSRIGNFASVLDSFPAGILPDEIFTPGRGQVKALFVSAGNPVLSCANGTRMEKAIKQLELVVCIDLFRNETGNLADYVLPGLTWLERPDIPVGAAGLQTVPYIQWTDAMVQPDGEQQDEWWIYTELARACGVRLFGDKSFGGMLAHYYFMANRYVQKLPLLGNLLAFDPAHMQSAMLLGSLRVKPAQMRSNPGAILLKPNLPKDFLGSRVLTEDGKVDLAPAEYIEGAKMLESDFEREIAQRDQLRLISKRERFGHNSWMHNVQEFVFRNNTNFVYMHPDDAERCGLKDRELAEVRSATGNVTLPVKLTDDMMPRAIALPHGWGHQRADGLSVASRTTGVNANLLAPDGPASLERFAGMALMNGIPVEVRRAGG